jgi:hypothetical protein
VRELPVLQELATAMRARGLELVTVMLDGHPLRARRVAEHTGLLAPVVLGDHELLRKFRVEAYPWTVVIGRDGRAKRAIRGGRERGEFQRVFEKYL